MIERTDSKVGPSPIGPRDVETVSADGTLLRGRAWTVPEPRAVLAIVHGLGEHGGSYQRLAEELARVVDIEVVAFDFRGSGRSPGRRGFVRAYEDLTADVAASVDWAAREHPELPRFLLGHSNGGLVSIRTVQGRDLGIAGLILSNPSLRLSAKVPPWKRAVAEVLRRVAPRVTLSTGLMNDQLTRDPEVIAAIEQDLLRHDRISAPMFFGMTQAGPVALAEASRIRVPTLLILGEDDPIIDPTSGRLFFETLGSRDKTIRIYPGMRHEPLNELGREVVIADVARWLRERLG